MKNISVYLKIEKFISDDIRKCRSILVQTLNAPQNNLYLIIT